MAAPVVKAVDGRALDTIFFGGGTPSRVTPAAIEAILACAKKTFGWAAAVEITLEANPTTADAESLRAFRQAGVNRLSLGVQSLSDTTLRLLGRMHNSVDAVSAYNFARAAGFDSVNTDLIFSVPMAPAQDLSTTLERLLAMEPDHISAYALSVEPDTPFYHRRQRGDLPLVDEDDDATAFMQVQHRLRSAGYEHYEISNYARPGHRCRHNWDCWTRGQYLGVGLSAHSFIAGERFWNVSDLDTYCEMVEGGKSVRAGSEQIDFEGQLEERIWLGLRTCEGVTLSASEQATVCASVPLSALMAAGQMQLQGAQLQLAPEGFAIADAVAASVIDVLAQATMVAAQVGQA